MKVTIIDHDKNDRPAAGELKADFTLDDNRPSAELIRKLVEFSQQVPEPNKFSERLADQFVHLAYWTKAEVHLCIENITERTALVGVRYPKYPELECVFDTPERTGEDVQRWREHFVQLAREYAGVLNIQVLVDQQPVTI